MSEDGAPWCNEGNGAMTPVEVVRGDGPVILGLPHTGTAVPAEIFARLNETGRALADTDWHIDRLYRGLLPGATTVRATFHRYVLDANRGPDDASLYPGQNTTGLCPVTDFDGRPIWREGEEPTAEEIAGRNARLPCAVSCGADGGGRAGAGRRTGWRSSTTATRSAA